MAKPTQQPAHTCQAGCGCATNVKRVYVEETKPYTEQDNNTVGKIRRGTR